MCSHCQDSTLSCHPPSPKETFFNFCAKSFFSFLSASSSISKHCFWSLMEFVVGQEKEAMWTFFFFSLPLIKGKGKKNPSEFSASFMFVDPLTFLYPGSNLTVNGRKSQGSGVILRAGPSCAVKWKEETAAEQVHVRRASQSRFRCAPLPAFHAAAHVHWSITFHFLSSVLKSVSDEQFGNLQVGILLFGLYI